MDLNIFSFQLNSTFPLSKAEGIRLTTEQELSLYLNRNLAKHKLKRTQILNEKKHIELLLEKDEKEKHQIIQKMENIRDKISGWKGKLIEIMNKIDACEKKIELYSK